MLIELAKNKTGIFYLKDKTVFLSVQCYKCSKIYSFDISIIKDERMIDPRLCEHCKNIKPIETSPFSLCGSYIICAFGHCALSSYAKIEQNYTYFFGNISHRTGSGILDDTSYITRRKMAK